MYRRAVVQRRSRFVRQCFKLVLMGVLGLVATSIPSLAKPVVKSYFGWFMSERFSAVTIRQEEHGRLFQRTSNTRFFLDGEPVKVDAIAPWTPVECVALEGHQDLIAVYAVTDRQEKTPVLHWLDSSDLLWYEGHSLRVAFEGDYPGHLEPYAFGLGAVGRIEYKQGYQVAVWDGVPPGSIRGGLIFLRDRDTGAILSRKRSFIASRGCPRITDVLICRGTEETVTLLFELSNEGLLPKADTLRLRVAGQDVPLRSRGVKYVVADIPLELFRRSLSGILPYKLFFRMEKLGSQEIRGWLPVVVGL